MTIHLDRTGVAPAQGRSEHGEREIPRAAIGRVLASDRRREVVRHLLEAEEPITVQRLVGWVADAEDETAALATIHELRQRVHVALRRTHLPLLERHGVVRYDDECGLVSPAANLAALESALEAVDLDRPW